MKYFSKIKMTASVFLAAMLVSGCATMGMSQKVEAPTKVLGLSYSDIAKLGALEESCEELAKNREDRTKVKEDTIANMVENCELRIVIAQHELSSEVEEAEADAISQSLVADYKQFVNQRELKRQQQEEARKQQEKERKEEQEKRKKEEELQEELKESQREHELEKEELKEKLINTKVQAKLEDYKDKPIAYNVGDPTDVSLKEFMACVELAYENKGYKVKEKSKQLNITVKDAKLPRGDLPIEVSFKERSDYWRMTYLKVADMEAKTDADRYVLSRNITAVSCPDEDGIFN